MELLNNFENDKTMIEKFGLKGMKIFEVELTENKDLLVFTDACDLYYTAHLNKHDVVELADDLIKISKTMIDFP